MLYIFSLLLLIFPSISFAGIFDPPTTDKSVYFLENIFGNMGNMLYGITNVSLQSMFSKYNWAIISIGVIIVGYTTFVSAINSAKEGQAMGKKWNSVWVPLRSMLGMLLLIPTAGTGYSLIQIIIMWIVVQGVGLADSIWSIVLDNLSQNISVTANPRLGAEDKIRLEEQAKTLFKSALVGAMCQQQIQNINQGKAYPANINLRDANNSELTRDFGGKIGIHQDLNYPYNSQITNNGNRISTVQNAHVNLGVKLKNSPYNKVCGNWTFSTEISAINNNRFNVTNARLRSAYSAKINALKALYERGAKPIAKKLNSVINQRDLDLVNIRAGIENVVTQTAATYVRSLKNYVSLLSGQVQYVTNNSRGIQEVTQTGKDNGWVVAGSYYFALYKVQQQRLLETIRQNPPTVQLQYEDNNAGARAYLTPAEYNYVNMNYQHLANTNLRDLADIYLRATRNISDPGFGLGDAWGNRIPDSEGGQVVENILNLFSSLLLKVANLFFDHLQSDTHNDPLVAMASVGQTIMDWAQSAWLAFAALGAGSSMMAMWAAGAPGLASFVSILTVLVVVGGIVLAILMMLFVLGVSIGIYLPMVPYLIFAGAVLGWMLLVIEAIVAGPVIALGIIAPSQEEIGKVMPAIMVLGNIFLRPMLMIFGFIIAARLLKAIVTFINFGFFQTGVMVLSPTATGLVQEPTQVVAGAQQQITGASLASASTTMLSVLFLLIIYCTFLITISNRVFALIYVLPDKIMRWIGGQAEATAGEVEKILGETKGGYERGKGEVSKIQAGMGIQALRDANKARNKVAQEVRKRKESVDPNPGEE